ncbi:MAG: Na+/H+ antiporter subunit C [Caldithrix sp.]|nr:Na+/H+ antiporter subunit C [Caldithrix sp.]
MQLFLPLIIGILFSAGFYLLLRRNLLKVILGIALVAHAANLLIFTMGGLKTTRPPIIAESKKMIEGLVTDPLPQALILTAIVIGFGVQVFALILARRLYQQTGISDINAVKNSDVNTEQVEKDGSL